MEIDELISEMQAVKAAHPALEISEVLRLFNIQALLNLIDKLEHLRLSNYGRR